jgi:hypothetical protein
MPLVIQELRLHVIAFNDRLGHFEIIAAAKAIPVT